MSDILNKLNVYSVIALILIPLLAIVGAYVNVYAKNDATKFGIVWLFIMSLFVTVPWVLLVRHGFASLSVTSAIFDVFYSLSYFIAFVCLGESATFIQWIGVVVSLIGVVLMTI